MSAQDQATQLHRVYEAYQTRDFEEVAGAFRDDARLVNVPTGDVYHGREGYLQFARGWAAAFPDLRVEIGRIDATGEGAVVEYTFRGTHTGAVISNGGFIPPTWAQVDFRLCDALELVDGEIVRLSSYFDSATMLRQMGLLPNSPLHSTDRRAPLELYATAVDSSVEQRNKAIVHRFLEEVVNQKNPAAAVAICAPDLAWHGGAMGEARNLAAFQSLLASVFASFPDLNLEVHDIIAEEDRVAVRVTLRGTQLGEFQGVPPTGKQVTSSGMTSYRIQNNRIVEEWWQHDLMGMMKQLNAVSIARSSP